MRKWLKHIKFKKLLLFILVLFLVGFIFGFLYYFSIDSESKKNITTNLITLKDNLSLFRTNNILLHLGITIILVILSITILGLPFIYFYLFYEALSMGFSFTFIVSIFGFKGIIFALLHFFFYKLLYIIFIIFLILRCSRISKNVLGLLIYRGNVILRKNLSINIKKVLLIILFIFLNDVVIYFVCLNINKLLIRFL